MATGNMVEGKVAIVTGAGRGIGREIALMLANHGAKVVVNDLGGSLSGEGHDKSPAEEVVAMIGEAGGEAVANTDSVAERAGAENMVKTAIDAFGRIDCVVNNAGILRDAMFHKMSQPDWDAVIAVHLNGAFHVSRAAAQHFREQGSGAFVHMTSTSGLIGNMGQTNYGAAKMGIVGLSRNIAIDMAHFNVRSNCIAPAAWSRLIASIPTTSDAEAARMEKFKAMTPDKNAPLAVFLCSDAAKEVTGQIFAVRMNEVFLMSQPRPVRAMHRDGGWTPETVASDMLPAFRSSFTPLESLDAVFGWDPI